MWWEQGFVLGCSMGLATSKYSVGGGGSLEDKGSRGKFGVSCLILWRFDAEMGWWKRERERKMMMMKRKK